MATVKFAVIDVTDFLSKKQSAEPDLAADWAKLEELYNKKLWHQLTLKLLNFVTHPALQRGDNLIQLYSNFLTTFENKINPLSLVEIVAHIVEQYTDKKEAVSFLEKIENKVKINDEAMALCKVLQGQIYLEQLSDLDNTERVIDHLEKTLHDADGVTPVHGRFYKLASHYYRVRGPMHKYYRAGLRYIGCCSGGDSLPLQERRDVAKALSMAAVIAHNVYDLDELLAHPILSSLENTGDAWCIELVRATARGDVTAYEKIVSTVQHPDLIANDTTIRRKIALLCLMEMSFNRPSSQRRLTFSSIASAARVPLGDVELLLMKALAEKLIRGHIDQVSSTAYISWVRGRALDRTSVSRLAARLDAWCDHVQRCATRQHAAAPDLITV